MSLLGKCVIQQCISAKLTVKPAQGDELEQIVKVGKIWFISNLLFTSFYVIYFLYFSDGKPYICIKI